MRISTLAFANLTRRKAKAWFLVAGIAIGIGTVVALLSLSSSIQEEIGAQLDRFGANIIIVPQSNSLALDYGGVSVPGVEFDVRQLHNADIEKIRNIRYHNRLSVIAPKVVSAVDVEGQQMLLAGVDLKNELKLHRWWRITGQTPETEKDVLLGYEIARALSAVQPDAAAEHTSGDHHTTNENANFKLTRSSVNIAGQPHRIVGVIAATGGPEDRMIFGLLPHVQVLTNRADQINVIEVSALCKGCPIEDIVAQIREQLPNANVSAIQQAVKARTEMVNRLARFSAILSAIVLIIGGLMIFTTMMASVIERTREIGVLRAIGYRRMHVMRGLLIEVLTISALGGLLGWAAGIAASWAALPYFSDSGLERQFHPWLLGLAVVSALMVTTISSIYPVVRASGLDPSEAVRSI
jgi:putative ABC transport system permease protein